MNAGDKFLALAVVLFALAVCFRLAPVAVILLILVLLGAAYFAVKNQDRD